MGNEQMVVVKDNSLNSHLPAAYQNYQVREAAKKVNFLVALPLLQQI